MTLYPVRGKLRFHQDNFESDYQFVRERVSEISNPEIREAPGQERVKFWWVDFAATTEQWITLEPLIDKRGIYSSINEDFYIHLQADIAEEQYQTNLQRRTGKQVLFLTAGIITLAVSAFLWINKLETSIYLILFAIALGLISFSMRGTVSPRQYIQRWNERVIQEMVRRNSNQDNQ